eukprot:2639948-Prymnesium_polylepis.1
MAPPDPRAVRQRDSEEKWSEHRPKQDVHNCKPTRFVVGAVLAGALQRIVRMDEPAVAAWFRLEAITREDGKDARADRRKN